MSSLVVLPSTLASRLQAVAKRVRLLRVVRGLSLLVLALSLTAAAAVLADYCLELPAVVRRIDLALWFTLGAVVGMAALLRPLSRKLDPADLAAIIEEKYPDLAERLTSSVELAGQPGKAHGSRALIAQLIRETERQTRRLDFLPAISPRLAAVLGGCAAVALLFSVTPLVVGGPGLATWPCASCCPGLLPPTWPASP